jgi:hypothetical protein
MTWIARGLGVLLIAYGLLGSCFVALGPGQGFTVPVWNDLAWTADARRAADWATYMGLALGGLLLVLNNWAAIVLCALSFAVIAARLGYDLALGDPSTARMLVMVRGDAIAAGAAALGVLAAFFVGRKRTTGSADAI